MHADLSAFARRSPARGKERLSQDEHEFFDKELRGRVYEVGDALYERGIRGKSLPIFAVIGPYALADADTLALTVEHLQEAIEEAKAAQP